MKEEVKSGDEAERKDQPVADESKTTQELKIESANNELDDLMKQQEELNNSLNELKENIK